MMRKVLRKGIRRCSLKGRCAISLHAGMHRADSRPQGKQAWARTRGQ